MFWKFSVASVLISTVAGSALADVTVCNGDTDCTVVDGQNIRKMSAEEARAYHRQRARDEILDVDCGVSNDQGSAGKSNASSKSFS